jgi:HEAT repeat protein
MKRIQQGPSRPRIRWRLLVLLWIWAACVFLILDLFLNVDAFDAIRPRALLYRGTRVAAHKMVGEPIRDTDFPGLVLKRPNRAPLPAAAHASAFRQRLGELKQLGKERAFEALRAALTDEPDPRHRVAAMRVLAESFGEGARETLLARMRDHYETEWVRGEAAHFVGWTGPGSFDVLDQVLTASWPVVIRAGALRGLGRHGSVSAVRRAIDCLGEDSPPLTRAAREVLERASDPEAVGSLVSVAHDPCRENPIRVAACRGMGRTRASAAVGPLAAILDDGTVPDEIRAAAVEALGRTRDAKALRIVANHCNDASPVVARAARKAKLALATARRAGRNGT